MKKTLLIVIVGILFFSVLTGMMRSARASETRILVMFVDTNTEIDDIWSLPNGTTFTFRGWLQNKGYSVFNVSQAFPTGEITLSGLLSFNAILVVGDFFVIPENTAYVNTVKDYVKLGGGLVLFGQHSHPTITIDEAFGFRWSGSAAGPVDPWSFYVDAAITDHSHPVMQNITGLPKAGGVFIDWDTLIDETPVPTGATVLARSTGTGGAYDPPDRIALIAFQHENGKVVVGPWDGLVRPFGPTAVNGWSVVSEPVVENQLLINAINWVAGTPASALAVSIFPTSVPILIGQSVTLTSTVSGGYPPCTYQWYLDGAPVAGAKLSNWTFTSTASGTYYVYLKVIDAVENTAQSESAKMTVSSAPIGGHSFRMKQSTPANLLMPYLSLTTVLAVSFVLIRRKIAKETE